MVKYSEAEHASIIYTAMAEGIDVAPLPGSERFIGFGNTKDGYGPACIVDLVGTEYVAEPHVTWLPWTTPGNRIINFKWAMKHLAETREVMLIVEKKEAKFFEHFVKKGLLRKIGYVDNLPEIEEMHMYQYKRSAQ